MKYSVVLQDPFDFERFWLYLGIGLLLAAVAAWLAARFLKSRKSTPRGKSHPFRSVRLFFGKLWFLRMLRKIDRDYGRKRIDCREAHRRISLVVRMFAQVATGRPVTRMVQSEIQRLHYSRLANLIGRLYEPEFAPRPETDVRESIRQSKELIRQWK